MMKVQSLHRTGDPEGSDLRLNCRTVTHVPSCSGTAAQVVPDSAPKWTGIRTKPRQRADLASAPSTTITRSLRFTSSVMRLSSLTSSLASSDLSA